jgi:hypothetical protein
MPCCHLRCHCAATLSVLPLLLLLLAPAAGAAASDSWESSTIVSSAEDEVGKLRSAIKHLEAREVLSENGELKGVHSTASVRSMLSKLEAV